MKIQSNDLYLFFKISKVLSYMLHTRPKEWATRKVGSRDADASKNKVIMPFNPNILWLEI